MQRSEERILTTHVGSLPRHPKLSDLLVRQDRGEVIDEADARSRGLKPPLSSVVRKQLEVGIDIGNDGEQPRVGFSTYVGRRMRGFGGESRRPPAHEMAWSSRITGDAGIPSSGRRFESTMPPAAIAEVAGQSSWRSVRRRRLIELIFLCASAHELALGES